MACYSHTYRLMIEIHSPNQLLSTVVWRKRKIFWYTVTRNMLLHFKWPQTVQQIVEHVSEVLNVQCWKPSCLHIQTEQNSARLLWQTLPLTLDNQEIYKCSGRVRSSSECEPPHVYTCTSHMSWFIHVLLGRRGRRRTFGVSEIFSWSSHFYKSNIL